MVKKRPCRICHRWFQPDRRVGDRQRACPRSECQAERRKRAQAAWRKRHPEYAIAWRIGRWAADEDRDLPRVPPPLPRVPWDLAKDEFGDSRCRDPWLSRPTTRVAHERRDEGPGPR